MVMDFVATATEGRSMNLQYLRTPQLDLLVIIQIKDLVRAFGKQD